MQRYYESLMKVLAPDSVEQGTGSDAYEATWYEPWVMGGTCLTI